MREFGLTGGIGSGKSTVSSLLAERGAVIIDADAMVRDLQRSGELVFDAMVERWGDHIVGEDGELDRAAVADIVFNDADELAALNGIVHPAVGAAIIERLDDLSETDLAVIHDIPLLVLPGGDFAPDRDLTGWGGIIVVDTPRELAIERVVASRGMSPDDVEARMDTQATNDERRARADFVIDNSGDLAALEQAVAECWDWIEAGGTGHRTPNEPTEGSVE
jgi:dephospho-CoA kinase